MKNIKIVVTDENDKMVFQSSFKDFVNEIVSSDNSTGYDTRSADISIEDFGDMVKELIAENYQS